MRLAENQGKSLTELLTGKPGPLSVVEFCLWRAYRNRFGFAVDRIEGTIANAGAATARVMGGKVRPDDLIAEFGGRAPDSPAKLINTLAALPGAKVVYTPNDATQPVLRGTDALAMLDPAEVRYKTGRTLDGPAPPRKPRNRNTLSGD